MLKILQIITTYLVYRLASIKGNKNASLSNYRR